jgi:hypothetical protein
MKVEKKKKGVGLRGQGDDKREYLFHSFFWMFP